VKSVENVWQFCQSLPHVMSIERINNMKLTDLNEDGRPFWLYYLVIISGTLGIVGFIALLIVSFFGGK
jgi:hypothetical protein